MALGFVSHLLAVRLQDGLSGLPVARKAAGHGTLLFSNDDSQLAEISLMK
jgi:hypothetical protein